MPRGNPGLLRPVGTECYTVVYPSQDSTETRTFRHVMRVVAHVVASQYVGDTEGYWAEEIRCVAIEPESLWA